jgi:uncharacterized membrane protein
MRRAHIWGWARTRRGGILPKDLWFFPAVGLSSVLSLGSTAAEGLSRIGEPRSQGSGILCDDLPSPLPYRFLHVLKCASFNENYQLCFSFRGREAHSRSFAKAVSWRITGTIDTFVISAIVTGKATTAGLIAATEVLTKIVRFYFHERIWTVNAPRRRLVQQSGTAVTQALSGLHHRYARI